MLFLVGLLVGGLIFVLFLTTLEKIFSIPEERRLKRARQEFDELIRQHGYYGAKKLCPHRVLTFSQTGYIGVVAMTHQWCKCCGQHVGTARYVKHWYGWRWE